MSDLFELCRQNADYRALSALSVHLDLRYASPNNICGRDLYEGCQEAWLHREAFVRLEEAVAALGRRRPQWRLRIYDAARPLRVQAQLFEMVRGTPAQDYVADPQLHSVHNYGFAIDVGLQDEHGQELDLGTPFDAFDPLAQTRQEERFVLRGTLSSRQRDLRWMLRECLQAAGFVQHPLEWWHFEAKALADLKNIYPILP